jgi:hypothetical protein
MSDAAISIRPLDIAEIVLVEPLWNALREQMDGVVAVTGSWQRLLEICPCGRDRDRSRSRAWLLPDLFAIP